MSSSLASVAAQQGAQAGASTSAPASSLTSLTNNFSSFLQLLMTQLQNQDPTSPIDTSQFTTELVQFTGVQQQINTNTSLTQLIQLTQSGELMQGSQMVGKKVDLTSQQLALQNGQAQVQFTATAGQPVQITVTNSNGAAVQTVSMTATQGSNTWTWNGQDSSGQTLPDGAYGVSVIGGSSGGSAAALPFTVIGTATGVQQSASGNAVQLEVGALTVPFSAIQSVNTGG